MTQSIVRYLIVSLMAYLVGHHVITQEIADANVAAWTNFTIIALTVIGTIAWSYLEKKSKGVLAAYFPDPTTLSRTPPATKGPLLLFLACVGAAYALFAFAS